MDGDEISMSQRMTSAPSVYSQVTTTPSKSGRSLPPPSPGGGRERSRKYIQCPVHEQMRLSAQCIEVIDTQPFQRLRDLKQLGTTHFVFPSATHTRFEHSLGVAHRAHELAEQIYRGQGAELGMTMVDVQTVTLAGLGHDLGHGPFSHVFDSEFLRQIGITGWSHEQMSADILDLIVENLEEEKGQDYVDHVLPASQMVQVKNLILCAHRKELREQHQKKFLFDIVANGINGIDVDKFDYLARDSMHLGIKISCNFNRILRYSKVIDNQICFRNTEYNSIVQLFNSRAQMHNEVYTHRKSKAVEFMIVDALVEADKVMRFSDKVHSAAEFVTLDDGLLRNIEDYHLLTGRNIADEELGPIRAAQAICKRLRRRDIYAYVDEITIPPHLVDDDLGKVPSGAAADIISCYSGPVKLREDDVIISMKKVNFGMGASNPLDAVQFFEQYDDSYSFSIDSKTQNSMMPQNYRDHKLRVFSRSSNPERVAALREGFQAWIKLRFGGVVRSATPRKTSKSQVEERSNDRKRKLFGGDR